MPCRQFVRWIVVLLASASSILLARPSFAADWPAYRGDARRSGYAVEPLPAELSLRWTYQPRHAPQPAWSGRDTRMPFDCAFHVAVADGAVFFGSSADDKVYALDAATGRQRWSFFTSGPVRFAPAVADGRVFVVSDDGFLYCLVAKDGRLLWKRRGGPGESMVLGNGRMVSRWPARGGPAVADGVVYFAAGIWPSEGIYVYALDAASGKVRWCNDSSGSITMPQPHGTAVAASGVSAQGNLVVAGDVLLVPTGRAVPAAFRRANGEFLHFRLQENGRYGGASVLALDDLFLNGGAFFETVSGQRVASLPALPPDLAAATPHGLVFWQDGKVKAARLTEKEAADRKGGFVRAKRLEESWSAPVSYGGSALVTAGKTVISAGPAQDARGVSAIDIGAEKEAWSARLDGIPWGLAVADEQLYVSTDQGTIYCFGQPRDSALRPPVAESRGEAANGADEPLAARAAEEILTQSGVTEGYCLDLGCGDGSLALALARRSKLHVLAVDSDASNVAAARQKLDAAGLYGVRVAVCQGSPADAHLAPYFANLIVSGRSIVQGWPTQLDAPMNRCLRPSGGVALVGKPGAMRKTVRGPLAGAGSWTHQYCDPANTNCSADALVRGTLDMLWFNDLNFPMPSRHGRGRSPLFLDGRLFIEGLDGVLAVDAYNGRKLWDYPLPGIQAGLDGDPLMGVSGMGSNFCVAAEGLFVHDQKKCLRLDPASGKLLATFEAPTQADGRPGTWGVIACARGTLFGTLADASHLVTYRFKPGDMSTQFTESKTLLALDAKTGRLQWRYDAEQSIRHNTIAIGAGRVYLIDRAPAAGDRRLEKRRGQPDPGDVHAPGKLVALDAIDGRVVWNSDEDIFGTVLVLSEPNDTLLMCYQDWRFKLASELGGRIAAFEASTGRRRWEVPVKDLARPIINGRTVYMQPSALDLVTGKPLDFKLERSYGCGIPAGSTNMLLFRSATLGYTDLSGACTTENYGGIRPGCWINVLPAGGLVLMPDATDRCTCSYLIKASIALVPR